MGLVASGIWQGTSGYASIFVKYDYKFETRLLAGQLSQLLPEPLVSRLGAITCP